ncbi:branched-chain amino acid ABC transporter permease [Aneurinibacillus thermoaerophilus]|uniref:Branched-chain amino acid ABC transporter permease n=1 Tax=Aneurinibacillus thermoaerophilus TaxID=143495 RepID=A0ABX8YDL4_ANETH|nr:branched-chain amino acid ABC transporter permease [Aneurinibacillus thermoaerophilus]QYY43571.1 branched-chain amino acid ABC transporter permease [Aneurinibacillus thermoaerophilus]
MKTNIKLIYSRSLKGPLVLTFVLLALPFLIPSPYFLGMMVLIGFYTIVGTGLSMLMGYAGQISLGHAAFYGVGAYTSAILTAKMGMPALAGIAAGALVALIIAYIVGVPTLKLTEHYLSLATLGFGVIVFIFFKQLKGLTGGLDGFFGIPPLEIFGFEFTTDFAYYYLVWPLAICSILFARNVIQSRVGRALRSIHGSETASSALGVNTQKYKLQVFMMSAVYAAVAGSLYAHYVTFISPQLFEAMASIHFLIMVIIGGMASIWGGMVGAAVFVFLSEGLKEVIPLVMSNASGEFEIVFFGVLLVALLIYMPEGLVPALAKTWKNLRRKKDSGGQNSRNAHMELEDEKEVQVSMVGGGER